LEAFRVRLTILYTHDGVAKVETDLSTLLDGIVRAGIGPVRKYTSTAFEVATFVNISTRVDDWKIGRCWCVSTSDRYCKAKT
jgi:hypothetical protein